MTTRVVVNAAGGGAAALARTAGLEIPVQRQKRTVFAFRAADPPLGRLPLLIEPGRVWMRPEGDGFIAGCSPAAAKEAAADDFEPQHELWEEQVWPALAERSPQFEALKLTGMWAGHYDMNTVDANAIIGEHPQVRGLLSANGFSGHGLQQAPAVGRGLAEWIMHGEYRTLDLTPLGWARLGERHPSEAVVI